ncbi:sigma factor-like helix-turn-helix DNA-binding protein [Streptomyces sp. NPDC048696]|uniref:sigma factor-like helix-turn-helix DNA-binding protein n=1 Tax=Streptomyces sp. NPDC048696 TaxID=3365585 RepID=UPI003714F611
MADAVGARSAGAPGEEGPRGGGPLAGRGRAGPGRARRCGSPAGTARSGPTDCHRGAGRTGRRDTGAGPGRCGAALDGAAPRQGRGGAGAHTGVPADPGGPGAGGRRRDAGEADRARPGREGGPGPRRGGALIERESVEPGLHALPVRERRILYLRYFQGMAQKNIGRELGISQMQVCRLLGQCCELLRDEAMWPDRQRGRHPGRGQCGGRCVRCPALRRAPATASAVGRG